MRLFISALILILTLQSWAKAENINDFEIEGISIGDTALKILNRNEIMEEFKIGKDEYSWTDQKFTDLYSYTSGNARHNREALERRAIY